MFRQMFQEFLSKRGVSQKEVSDVLGISQQSISKLFNHNGNVRRATMEGIFKAYPDFEKEYKDYLSDSSNTTLTVKDKNKNNIDERFDEVERMLKNINMNVLKLSLTFDEHRDRVEEIQKHFSEREDS